MWCRAVTSFAPAQLEVFGRRFVETFLEHWQIDLEVWYEGPMPEGKPFESERLIWRDLLLTSLPDFHAHMGSKGRDNSLETGAVKWSHKVWAIVEAMQRAPATVEWLLWIDADVETTAPCDDEFLSAVCPKDKDVSFLGRPWAYASETGFVAYRIAHPAVRAFLECLRATYTTGAYLKYPSVADNYVFDRVREDCLPIRWNNLASHLTGPNLHVWPATVLGTTMRHNKGPARKMEAYGRNA